jgi:integrase
LSEEEDALLLRALEILQRRAAAPATPSLTLRQLYVPYEAARKRSPGWRVVKSRFVALLDFVYAPGTPPLGDQQVMGLKIPNWTDYRSGRMAHEWKPGRFYTDHSINCELQSLKAILSWAVIEGRIPYNPLANAKREGPKSRRRTAPSERDIGLFLDRAGPRERYMILAAVDAGMRRNEIRLCQHDWVDHEAKRIHLDNAICKNRKGGTIPATQRLLDAIEAIPRDIRGPWILTNPETGQPYTGTTMWTWFRAVVDGSGVRAAPGDRRVVLHDGRHAAATNAVKRGVPVTTVQLQMRHADISTTMIYVDTSDADFGPALEKFEAGIVSERERIGPKRAPSDGHVIDKSKLGKK